MIEKTKTTKVIRITTLSAATLLAGILLSRNDKAFAAESTLSLSISSSTVSTNVTPTSISGTFRKGTESTISASTDNTAGYTLSISASSSSGSDYDKLINTSDNTAKINSISSPTTEEQYEAANATSYNNTWGYLPSRYCPDKTSASCTDNTSYLPAPTTEGDILDQTTTANTTANTYTIGMATRIDANTKSGNYTSGSFVVKMVANAIPYTITYDKNTTDTVSNLPSNVSAATLNTSINLENKTPARNGYNFLGWCTVAPTNSNNKDNCTNGTIYQPNASLSINQTGTNNFQLHAMWEKQITYLQNLAASKCTTTMSTAVDSRDGTEYHIQRLADGKCWLLDNLALDLVARKSVLTSSNTNASDAILNYLKNGGGANANQYANAGVAYWTSGNSYTAPLIAIKNASDTSWNPNTVSSDATSQTGQYKVGVYYNYCAASAGSYCYDTSSAPSDSQNGVRNIAADICPKGWRMPTGDTSGEYQALYNNSNYNTYNNYRKALRLPISGFFLEGSASGQGSYGYFWSSTRDDSYFMHILGLLTGYAYPSNYSYRYYGNSIRCVLGS